MCACVRVCVRAYVCVCVRVCGGGGGQTERKERTEKKIKEGESREREENTGIQGSLFASDSKKCTLKFVLVTFHSRANNS